MIAEKEKTKTIPVKEGVHAQIVACATERGMTIQGLAERIIRAWLADNFFAGNVANSNTGKRRARVAR